MAGTHDLSSKVSSELLVTQQSKLTPCPMKMRQPKSVCQYHYGSPVPAVLQEKYYRKDSLVRLLFWNQAWDNPIGQGLRVPKSIWPTLSEDWEGCIWLESAPNETEIKTHVSFVLSSGSLIQANGAAKARGKLQSLENTKYWGRCFWWPRPVQKNAGGLGSSAQTVFHASSEHGVLLSTSKRVSNMGYDYCILFFLLLVPKGMSFYCVFLCFPSWLHIGYNVGGCIYPLNVGSLTCTP